MKIKKIISSICAIFIFSLLSVSVFAAETNAAPPSADGNFMVLYEGNQQSDGRNSFLIYFFTKHVGGEWDASSITEGSFFYAEYLGASDGVYLSFSSASGGPGWVAVYADETGTTAEGNNYSIFRYDNFSNVYGNNFARLDQIQAYSNTDESVTLKKIAYVDGGGNPVDTSDGTWDRPDSGIAFIGDSIVQNPLTNGSDLKNLDWNGILGRTDCANYGIASQTTVQCADRIDELAKKNYDKAVILCGINDLGHGYANSKIIANYEKMITALKEKNPKIKIYIISVLPTTSAFFKNQQWKIVALNTEIKLMTEEMKDVTYVDCHTPFVGEDGYCRPELVIDGLHPNLDGYAIIADTLNPYLSENASNNGSVLYIVIGVLVAAFIATSVCVAIRKFF